MIDAIIFDMDGVIIDSEPFWLQAEQEVFATLGIRLTEEMWRNTVGIRIDEAISHWHSKFSWNLETASLEKIKHRIVERLIELIHTKGEPMDGLDHILRFFKQKKVRLALASSSDFEIIHTVIDKFSLKSDFQVIHSAELEEYGKPHPAVYISTARKLKVSPTNCLALEDSFNGVLSAKAARMKCVSVPQHGLKEDQRFIIADAVLKSLTEFDDQLWEQLNAVTDSSL